jgi:hypothetical protein
LRVEMPSLEKHARALRKLALDKDEDLQPF